jgi:hypothetical protein
MGRGRVGIYDQHNKHRAAKLAAMTPQQRAAERAAEKLKLLEPVRVAPVIGDPESIAWEKCDCGYVPRTRPDGKPLPKSGPNAEDAWRWTEEKPRTGRGPYLRGVVPALAVDVYKIGSRHNPIELHSGDGFPDDIYWGRFGPKLIFRELKAMRPLWKRGQKQHLLSLQEAGLNVGVWFPCCLLSGLVEEEMAELAGVEPKGPYARRPGRTPNRPLTWEDIAEGALSEDA